MADANFQALLSQPVSEVERPKPLPAGSYVFTVTDFKFDKSAKKKTDFVRFELTPNQPMDDVDAEELKAALGDKTLTDKKMRSDYYITPDSMWRLDEFLLEQLGHEPGQERAEMIQASKGMQVVGMVSHRPSDRDENVVYAEISQFAKYEG
jgi:hypothetical protein